MAWVALPSSGIGYTADLPAGVAFDGDNLVATLAADGSFTIQFAALESDLPVRITANSYTAGGGESGNLYHAAQFSADNLDLFAQGNEAAPYPLSNWPDNEPVSAWSPSPMQTTLQSGNTLAYLGTRTTGDEIPVVESWSFLLEVDVEVPAPVAACEEIGQVSRANVSAHNRTRMHSVKVRPGEKRCLVANFNGAVPASRTITQAVWRMDSTYSASLSGGAITSGGRVTEVLVSAHEYGCEAIECTATFDNGEQYVQVFVVEVFAPTMSPSSNLPTGASSITVTAS